MGPRRLSLVHPPAGWIDRLDEYGRTLAADAGLDLNDEDEDGARQRRPAARRLEGARTLELGGDRPGEVRADFPGPDGAAAACELARQAYGDPAHEFTLALLPVLERGVVVELLPAPAAAAVTVRVVFGPGAERAVEIPVPEPDTPVWKRGQSAAISDVVDPARELVGVVATVEGGAVVLTCETRPKK